MNIKSCRTLVDIRNLHGWIRGYTELSAMQETSEERNEEVLPCNPCPPKGWVLNQMQTRNCHLLCIFPLLLWAFLSHSNFYSLMKAIDFDPYLQANSVTIIAK
ncbi:hypothetical protein PDIG_65680 [Penicillium digitatum PHI26]|uniref:Uncharacterized protein n=2 Tax=Penicillium digitatum TaxID=36651 RepID=K9FHI4_PEND2|nr:hypothetical protein PDIP_75000 [Penicillium digitatum Pd1]EKV07258.1 hypothetical protein PDIP_75000 [Penicillium digitatum Pd1]EKV08704.1 hypothetical protein PDIG_65680 [Penicillium digitatum PHI26]